MDKQTDRASTIIFANTELLVRINIVSIKLVHGTQGYSIVSLYKSECHTTGVTIDNMV